MKRRQPGFFAALRRDGRLFAVVATLILALHALQPVAMAGAGEGGLHQVLCLPSSLDGASSSGEPVLAECDACVAGPCAGLARLMPPPAGHAPAFPAIETAAWPLPPTKPVQPLRRAGDPPPTSRAPPPSA